MRPPPRPPPRLSPQTASLGGRCTHECQKRQGQASEGRGPAQEGQIVSWAALTAPDEHPPLLRLPANEWLPPLEFLQPELLPVTAPSWVPWVAPLRPCDLHINFFFATRFTVFTTFFKFSPHPPIFLPHPPIFSPLNYIPRAFFTPNRHKPFSSNPDPPGQHGTSSPENIGGGRENLKKLAKTVYRVAKKIKFMGAEPRDRERSPGRGPEDPGRRAAAVAAQSEEGGLIRRSSGNFIGRFRAHPQPGIRLEGLHQLGVSPLNGLVSRGPLSGHSRPSYVKFIRLGRGDSDSRENWGQSEQIVHQSGLGYSR
jgi:hypothetical protein